MGKIENVVINLERKNAVFSSGDLINGSLDFKINEKIKINSLKLHIMGESECHWNEQEGKATRKIRAFDFHLKHLIDFLPKEEYGEAFFLNEGEYSYKFQIQLPQKLTNSLNHPNAETKYYLKAVFDVNWSLNKNFEKPFIVFNQTSFDERKIFPDDKRTNSMTKIYGMCCTKSAPVVAYLTVHKRYYLPGDEITFDVRITNPSSKPIKKLRVALVKEVKCFIGKKKREFKVILAKQENNDLIKPKTDGDWYNGKIQVPLSNPLSEPSGSNCEIININHFAELEVSSSFFTLKFRVAVPICLGLLPTGYSETDVEKLDENLFKPKK
jgi:hypothetical protein